MPLQHRLLQIGTLTLFCSMIAGLVIFQSGTLMQRRPTVRQDSLPPMIWFDSARFQKELERRHLTPMVRVDSVRVQKELEHARINRFPSTKVDMGYKPSLPIVMDILRMRYEVAQLNPLDALEFQMKCQQRTEGRTGGWISAEDSLDIWRQPKFHTQRLAMLSASEKQRFQSILDSLLRPRLMSSKSGMIFRHKADTMQALQILTAHPTPK